MNARRPRLVGRIFPYFLLITLVSLAGLGWSASRFLREFHLGHLRGELEARARLLRDLVAPRFPDDLAAVDAICRQASLDSNSRATVVLPDGKVIGESHLNLGALKNHADRPEIIAALAGQTGHQVRMSESVGQRSMYVAVPVRTPAGIAGVARVAVSVAGIEDTLRALQGRILAAGGLLALLAAGLLWWTSRRLAAPLERMQAGADRFAGGDLDFRLEIPETREFAGLATALNSMAVELRDRIAEIRRQQDEADAVLSSMEEGVLAVDAEERILRLNRAAARMLGLPQAQSVGRPVREVVRHPELLRLLSDPGQEGAPLESDFTLHGEPEAQVRATGAPLRTREGQAFGRLVVLNDITRLRRLEQMRRDFVANVSHELRTPVTAIKGFVETLTDGGEHTPEDVRRFHDIILKHANRLSAIIDDLLKLSRLEQDQGLPETSAVLAGDLIATLTQIHASAAEARRIRLVAGRVDEAEFQADAALLEQAVGNLVENAIKYSPEGTEVRLEAVRDGGQVEFRVIDQGPGIEDQHLPRLFERFYRVDKARSRQAGGTGLGLAIVKHIAIAHRGSAGVESRVGQGSRFWVRIPLDLPAA